MADRLARWCKLVDDVLRTGLPSRDKLEAIRLIVCRLDLDGAADGLQPLRESVASLESLIDKLRKKT